MQAADSLYSQLKLTISTNDEAGQQQLLERIRRSLDSADAVSDAADAIFEAVEDISDLTVLRFLLDQLGGSRMAAVRNEHNLSIVHMAALVQDDEFAAETMQMLREKLGDGCFGVTSRLNSTTAHFAAKNSSGCAVLKWMLENLGSDAMIVKDSLGDTAVHLAAEHQAEQCMELLKANLPLTNRVWQSRGALKRTPVHRAALNEKCIETLRWTLKYLGPDGFEKRDSENNTAVHLAARWQGEECMQMLKERLGMQCFRARGHQMQTAVHMAAMNENGLSALNWFVQNIDADAFLAKDANGDTAIHIAAEHQDDECMELLRQKLQIDHPVWLSEGALKRTPAHRAALNEKNICALKWMLDSLPVEAFEKSDAHGDTAIHLAALHQSDECMELLMQRLPLDSSVWQSQGAKGQLPIHGLAANARQKDFVVLFVEEHGSPLLNATDEELLTAVHIAASFQSLATFKLLVDFAGEDCLIARDRRGWTPLFMATGNERHEIQGSVYFWMTEILRDKHEMRCKDTEGRTCLHLCARNRAYGAQMFEQSAPLHGFDRPSDAVAESTDKAGRNPVFLACLLKNFNFLNADFVDTKHHGCTDAAGNTLLHALFLTSDSFVNRDFDADEFVSVVRKLMDGGADPRLENSMKRNCLMSAEFRQVRLYEVLLRLSHDPDLQLVFSALQTNSEGLHVVHVFSGRFDIRFLGTPLKQLFHLSVDKLLAIRVASGAMSGATCLHFACEAGHEDNIKYLISKGFCDTRLSCETVAGQTCVDFACNKGKLEVLISAAADAGVDLKDILLLVDPTKKALQLPDRSSARNLLALFTDPVLRSDIEKDRSSQVGTGDEAEGQASMGESAQAKLLIRALELDSTEMLRSLVVLDYVTGDTDSQLMTALRKRFQSKTTSNQKYFPDMLKLESIVSNRSEISLLDCAVFFDKANLLSDLMVLPQFDIIPQTLRLLIQVTPKVAMRQGRHEQLSGISTQALNVLTNALEQLYVRADESERQLLFRYLTAEFQDQHGVKGPKFPAPLRMFMDKSDSANQSDCLSVMQLIDTVDCDELFATDCLSRLADDQWAQPPPLSWRSRGHLNPECCCCCRLHGLVPSVRARLYTHMVFFVLFLCFFSWFVTDFGQSLRSQAGAAQAVDAVMWLYALSFTSQEINDMASRCERMDMYVWERHWRVPRYFSDLFNYFDLAAIALLWAGLILKLIGAGGDEDILHSSQTVLSASFLLWGFRSVSLLSYFKVTGPKISMLKSLLFSDLAPFLIIMAVLVYSFGIFYVNLLFPVTLKTASVARDSESVAKQVFTLPVALAFGFFEGAEGVVCNGTKRTLEECSDTTGYRAYSGLLMFLYLLIVNIVMWNLLIALFNLTVSRMDTKAEVIWRKNLYEMLVEFSEVSPVPPPLSFPHYAWKLWRRAFSSCSCCSGSHPIQPAKKQPWWRTPKSFTGYPEDFRRFLVFQAEQLRRCRPKLRQGVEKHRDAFEALRAHAEKTADGTREDLAREVRQQAGRSERELQGVREQLGALRSASLRQKRHAKQLGRQVSDLQQQMAQVLDLLRQQRV